MERAQWVQILRIVQLEAKCGRLGYRMDIHATLKKSQKLTFRLIRGWMKRVGKGERGGLIWFVLGKFVAVLFRAPLYCLVPVEFP